MTYLFLPTRSGKCFPIIQLLAFWLFIAWLGFPLHVLGQTKGLVVKQASAAGRAVLDPNGDGYVSASTVGFSANDIAESEIPYKALTVFQAEPTSDLAAGPSCGFTDFVDDATVFPAGTYLSPANNLMFRFRLGGYAPNSKGYSILIDTDNRFGNSGTSADPHFVVGNPGFEVEIELATNFEVRLYNVDGTTNPALLTTLPYADYAQKAIAYTTNCGDADYFYDFYIPFSVITNFIPSFTPSTPIRMVANTVIAPQSALKGPIADIGGINDAAYGGNPAAAWTAIVTASVPTSMATIQSGSSFPPVRSATPTVNGPLASGATTVSGTSSEPNGTTITIRVNGTVVGTATVSGGTWTLSGLAALASGATVTATATATGKSVSLESAPVTVGATCSTPPTITCSSAKGIGGTGPAGAATGTTIRIYTSAASISPITTDATNTFLYNCAGGTTNCTGGGPNCIAAGTYWVTAQEPGKCESAPIFICIGNLTPTPVPTIATNPVLPSTTTLTGTSVNNATITLYRDGRLFATTTASATGAWSASGLSFSLGQVITARAQSTGQCLSDPASTTVTAVTATPVVKGPISSGATSVSGTSTEAAGTVITVQRNGTSIGTTTVNASGSWTLTGISPVLATGNNITATATASGKTVSAVSATVTVVGQTTRIPTITGTYTEGGTSVSGTSTSPNNTTIKVYIDGVLLGSTTVSAGSWTLSNLSAAQYDLYAGGKLTATATENGLTEGPPSGSVTVGCVAPLDRPLNLLTNEICESTSAQVQVLNSEPDVIYTLRNGANTTNLSTSLLGTGGTLTFSTITFTAPQTVRVGALKIPLTTCTILSSGSVNVTVNAAPPTNNAVTYTSSIPYGTSTNINVASTTSGFIYQLRDNADNTNVGSAVTSTTTGSTVSLPTGPLTSNRVFYVWVTDATKATNCTSRLSANYTITVYFDNDNDGVADPVDLDDDNDGIPDLTEGNGTNPSGDADADGVPNYRDAQFAGFVDVNGDGVSDLFDKDWDGVPDIFDLDSDNDGLADVIEAGGVDPDNNGIIGNGSGITDADGDGLANLVDANEAGFTGALPVPDTDGDGLPDYKDLDDDNDGITDTREAFGFSLDVDGNGVIDLFTTNGSTRGRANGVPAAILNSDGDGVPNYLDLDSDNDGLADFVEAGGLAVYDTNNDGRIDLTLTDSDNDGLYNVVDPVNRTTVGGAGTGAPLPLPDTDGDLIVNYLDLDSDNDGIPDAIEANGGIAPANYISSGINLGRIGGTMQASGRPQSSVTALAANNDTDGDGTRDYLDVDADQDGIPDAVEGNGGAMSTSFTAVYNPATGRITGPVNANGIPTNASGLITLPDSDSDGKPDYVDTDSDNDGQADWVEAFDDNSSGLSGDDFTARSAAFVSAGGSSTYYPSGDMNGNGFPDWLDDNDGDGIPNFLDINSTGTSFYHDTDGDGINDILDPSTRGTGYAAISGFADRNGSFIPDYRDNLAVTPLPVKIAFFKAQPAGKEVRLTWITASELHNNYFEVQRSSDGKVFIPIGTVRGIGNATSTFAYHFTDQAPVTGINYYRLLQVDTDGKTDYSKIESVILSQQANFFEVSLHPNPSQAQVFVTLNLLEAASVQIEITSGVGQVLMRTETNAVAGLNVVALNVSHFKQGVYLVKVTGYGYQQVIRMNKL